MLDSDTGELEEKTLEHQGETVREFYSALSGPILVGIDVFEDEPPSAGARVSGATVSGCPACRKRINTLDQFFRHQSDDVLPVILRKAFEIAGAE
jgi:hypothetical protein